MARAIYLTHPDVVIDPEVAVPDWGLSESGAARVAALAPRARLQAYHVVSSAERKALETAWPLAAPRAEIEVRPRMHENDRSATGFLQRHAFEDMADAFFAQPEASVRGWERAVDVQGRILAEVDAVIAARPHQNLLFCGHGGAGTLLYCALAGQPISRRWDQKGGGHWFAFDTESRKPENHWTPMEALFA
ncbi:alpha-ribazole phosphatase [Tritonibacter multivorans]|uniref:Alpha-ribazole phosphatase n=1 Tax=Tritonibacter multivorans TaxID=928856 RepID=A0A0P1G2A5_9RHOB|nr:histidine phosphatase family protein [Tritonibacter multivorans]MDA7419672.1 phosphoglycerate mutase family protein [Tritonibacter multivorans]CUH75949.1 alpha-ribazole phosphatase [Tritonibacter multivorans]SFC58251.1 Broad specificity phosphatase PhoE [Tritonibacter multivorans]